MQKRPNPSDKLRFFVIQQLQIRYKINHAAKLADLSFSYGTFQDGNKPPVLAHIITVQKSNAIIIARLLPKDGLWHVGFFIKRPGEEPAEEEARLAQSVGKLETAVFMTGSPSTWVGIGAELVDKIHTAQTVYKE